MWLPRDEHLPPFSSQKTETAEQRHNEIANGHEAPLTIYTDGSGIHGKVGAAAVAPAIKSTSPRCRNWYSSAGGPRRRKVAKLLGLLCFCWCPLKKKKGGVNVLFCSKTAGKVYAKCIMDFENPGGELDGEAEAVCLIVVVIGVLAEEDDFDGVQGRTAGPEDEHVVSIELMKTSESQAREIDVPRIHLLGRRKDLLPGLPFALQELLQRQELLCQNLILKMRKPALMQLTISS
jgi:hypothetical protein